MGKKIELSIQEERNVMQAIMAAVPLISRAKADVVIKSGEVRVNGMRVKRNARLVPGDKLRAYIPDALLDACDIEVVYEDENIAVFNKPKHLAYDALPQMTGKTLYAVHRLDTNTSGVIVFAKTELAKRELERAFKERRTLKRYKAVVYPAPAAEKATLTAYTAVKNGIAAVSDTPKPGYKTMITEYEVLREIGGAAVLLVTPHTGRTHQIRAHLDHIGCPIVGDPKYGSDCKLKASPKSQLLAAVELSFSGLKNGLEYLNGRVFAVNDGFDLGFIFRPAP